MTLRKTTILVVDDEVQTLHLLSKSLSILGYTIVESSHGVEALDQMIAVTPDVLIVDLMMPHRVDGEDPLTYALANPRNHHDEDAPCMGHDS